MDTISQNTFELLYKGLESSYTYTEYKELVARLLAKGKSTAKEDSEAFYNYSILADKRMKRWDKTFKISEDDQSFFKNLDKKQTWLVLTEGWCGDAAHAIPVLNKLASLNENIDLRLVLRDEHEDLMDQFLTNGGRSIPKLIILDEKKEEILGTWGPRPSTATELVNAYKTAHGKIDDEFKKDLQTWYNKDKGKTIVEDLKKVLI